jgi:hypothetical protein
MRKTLLCFFWDEWLSINDQMKLIYKNDGSIDDDVLLCINDFNYTIGKERIYRLMNPDKKELEYVCYNSTCECDAEEKDDCICVTYKECSAYHIDTITEDTTEDMRIFTINAETTGQLFGFLVPKDKKFLFKWDNIDEDSFEDKVTGTTGKICINTTTIRIYHQNMLLLGEILEENNYTNFDLVRETIIDDAERRIKNSTRFCTLKNLLLRYIDALQIDDKRWFFRPVEAYYLGYGVRKSKAEPKPKAASKVKSATKAKSTAKAKASKP